MLRDARTKESGSTVVDRRVDKWKAEGIREAADIIDTKVLEWGTAWSLHCQNCTARFKNRGK